MSRRAQGGEVSNEVLVRYLQGEMTRSESEETERLIADSRRARLRLAELREMSDALRRPPDWVESTDLTAAVAARVRAGEAAAPGRPRRGLWWSAGAAAVAAAAALVLLVAAPWRPDGGGAPEEPRAKGGAAGDPDRWVGISLASRDGEPVGDRLPPGGLVVSYRNFGPTPYPHLMVFAIDAAGDVYWFYPAWQDAATDPAAIHIELDAADRVLPDLVEHAFPPGDLTVCGLFLRRPLTVREVEAALGRRRHQRLPFPDAGQHCVATTVK